MSDTDKIVALVRQFAGTLDMTSMVKPDFVYIRPSGNPITAQGLNDMMRDVTCAELWSMEPVKFIANGAAAVVLCKIHQTFVYKGTPNDDVATVTVVLEKVGSDWIVAHAHRATGVPAASAPPKTA